MNKYLIFCLSIIIIVGCKPNQPNQPNDLIGIWEHDTDIRVFTEETVIYPEFFEKINHKYTITGDQLSYYDMSRHHNYTFKVEDDTLYLWGEITHPSYYKGSMPQMEEQKWTRRNYTNIQIFPSISSRRPYIRHVFILEDKRLNRNNANEIIIAGDTQHWLAKVFKIRKYENKVFTDFLYIKGEYYMVLWCPDTEEAYISNRQIKMDETYIQIHFNDFELFENDAIHEIARELPYSWFTYENTEKDQEIVLPYPPPEESMYYDEYWDDYYEEELCEGEQ